MEWALPLYTGSAIPVPLFATTTTTNYYYYYYYGTFCVIDRAYYAAVGLLCVSARCDRICKTVSTTVCTVCRQTVELASFSTRNDSWKNIHFRVQSESSRLVTAHGTGTLA